MRVEGRSTLARLGLAVPTTHVGFEGQNCAGMYDFGRVSVETSSQEFAVRGLSVNFERLGRVPDGQVKTTYRGQKSIPVRPGPDCLRPTLSVGFCD